MRNLNWFFQTDPPAADVAELRRELVEHNLRNSKIAESTDLAVFVRDVSGRLVGGVTGNLWGAVLEVDFLWLHARLRGHGLGKQILLRLEAEARARGAAVSFLNTYSFQAPGFYQKIGYQVTDIIDGYPEGVQKFFLKKSFE